MHMKSFEEYKEELDEHGRINSITMGCGIYKIYMPQNFQIVITSETDAIKEYKGKTLLYSVQKLEDKWEIIRSADRGGILYIGKADNLRKRITEFIKYGYGERVPHRGGRAIWQLKNNKKLLIEIEPCEKPREKERQFLIEYYEKYNSYPYANWKK